MGSKILHIYLTPKQFNSCAVEYYFE